MKHLAHSLRRPGVVLREVPQIFFFRASDSIFHRDFIKRYFSEIERKQSKIYVVRHM